MTQNPYWKVLKYRISNDYNPRYPLQAIVEINGEPGEHLWFLPKECINHPSYDWRNAIKTDDLFKEVKK